MKNFIFNEINFIKEELLVDIVIAIEFVSEESIYYI